MTLLTIFSRLEDPRRGPAKRYDLSEMVVMAICAVLCGADDWVAVADWCEDEEAWLRTFLALPNGTSSHDTFGNVFRVLDPAVFESCFREWIGGLVGVVRDIIALDGKTARGSKDGTNSPLHLVSAYATSLRLTLGLHRHHAPSAARPTWPPPLSIGVGTTCSPSRTTRKVWRKRLSISS